MGTSSFVRISLGFCLVLLLGLPSIAAEEKKDPAKPEKATEARKQAALEKDVTQGALRIVKDDATVVECPLRHTDVKADIAGFIARVTVTQTFYNPTDEKIEAVYVFPLPHESAVDDMTMVVGKRKIVGLIKRRGEARRIYEQAIATGQTAALLEQERPNIFTQSVGNIEPGQEVDIKISYVDVLRYDVGNYEFHFPVVVGPRFNPGVPISAPQPRPADLEGKVSPPDADTTRVPDASKINPPVLKPGHRTGHDISLSVKLDAGVPIQNLKSTNHKAEIDRGDKASRAVVTLASADSIPNKDFVLRYGVVGKKPEMAVLSHTGDYNDTRRLGTGFFMLMIQPQEDERLTKSPPREIVFLIDVSGSMSGQPTQKVIKSMDHMLKLCRPIDTVQVITFAGSARELFEKPVPVNEKNIERALNFTSGLRGGGGTRMLQGIKKAIDQPIDKERLRIVVMLTDGYIGNEAEIVEHVGKNCGDQIRFWAIGMGQSPNMHLIDGVAKQGGGMGKKLGLNDDSQPLCQEIMTRIQRAQLAKVKIDWGDLDVAQTYPAKIPELWAGRPVILFGRYTGGGKAKITVSGNVEGEDVSWPLEVDLPDRQPDHDVLAKVWARKKIEDLMHSTYYFGSPAVEEEVTGIALDYRLMSQYTSFVAVDEKDADKIDPVATPPRRMLVPVPLPEGTQWEGFFGPRGEGRMGDLAAAFDAPTKDGLAMRAYAGNRPAGKSRHGMFGYMPASRPQATRALHYRLGQAANRSGLVPNTLYRQKKVNGRLAGPAGGVKYGSRMSGMGGMGGFGGGGRGVLPPEPMPLAVNKESAAAETNDMAMTGWLMANVLHEGSPELTKTAKQRLDAGKKSLEEKDFAAARESLSLAFFLDTASANRGNYQAGAVASEAITLIEKLNDSEVKAWTKDTPALSNKLDLILRDKSIEEALAEVAKTAGIKIRLLPGSLADARNMLGGIEPRVSYLDLRNATVVEAFDWILRPVRLRWTQDEGGGTFVVGSDRLLPGTSTWVYDVAIFSLPSAKELEKEKDHQKRVAAAKKAADDFIGPIRKHLQMDDKQIVWFAPGTLLVMGTPQEQAKANELLEALVADKPAIKLEGDLIKVRETARALAKERAKTVEKVKKLRQLFAVRKAHHENSWKLLAAALDNRLDLEALTELQIAWKNPLTRELLSDRADPVIMRSLWAVRESARMLRDEKELTALASQTNGHQSAAAEKALEIVRKTPEKVHAVQTLIYSVLTTNDAEHAAVVRRELAKIGQQKPASTHAALGMALLGDKPIDRVTFEKLVASGQLRGDDLVVLSALACKKAGGDVWSTFRTEAGSLMGKQGLSGDVVVLIGRLSGHGNELVARK